MKKSSKRRGYKVIEAILTVIIIIAFAFAASVFTYLTICGVQDSNDQKEFDKIAQTIDESNKDDSSDETNGVYDLMLKNKDCVGWLKIANTDIDYPVMLTKDEPEYYLRRDFNKEYSYMGTPFMDSNCNIGISKNLIIYGHNMKNGRMFAPLMKFKNKEYFDKNQIIEFITPNEKAIYHIVRLEKTFGSHVTDKEEYIKSHWLGRRTSDCVGLIKGYGWYDETSGTIKYGTNEMKDVTADGMFNAAVEKGPISTMPDIPGIAVWHQGHIGVYIGNGYVIHAANTYDGVIKTPITSSGWTHWLKVPYINYIEETDADSN